MIHCFHLNYNISEGNDKISHSLINSDDITLGHTDKLIREWADLTNSSPLFQEFGIYIDVQDDVLIHSMMDTINQVLNDSNLNDLDWVCFTSGNFQNADPEKFNTYALSLQEKIENTPFRGNNAPRIVGGGDFQRRPIRGIRKYYYGHNREKNNFIIIGQNQLLKTMCGEGTITASLRNMTLDVNFSYKKPGDLFELSEYYLGAQRVTAN